MFKFKIHHRIQTQNIASIMTKPAKNTNEQVVSTDTTPRRYFRFICYPLRVEPPAVKSAEDMTKFTDTKPYRKINYVAFMYSRSRFNFTMLREPVAIRKHLFHECLASIFIFFDMH